MLRSRTRQKTDASHDFTIFVNAFICIACFEPDHALYTNMCASYFTIYLCT